MILKNFSHINSNSNKIKNLYTLPIWSKILNFSLYFFFFNNNLIFDEYTIGYENNFLYVKKYKPS